MRKQFNSQIAWLVGFLNLKFAGGNMADKKRIERFFQSTGWDVASAGLDQAIWRRRLAWLAENATLTESLAVGIEVLGCFIPSEHNRINAVGTERHRLDYYDLRKKAVEEGKLSEEELGQDEIKSPQEKLEALIRSQRKMKELACLSASKLQSRKNEVIETLKVAKLMTREETFINLMNTLNGYSDKIKYSWQLRRAPKSHLAPGQGVLNINGKKFVVDRFPVGDDFDTYVSLVVSKCLENGSLDRLRRCRECRTFFYASHLAKEYCKPEHQKAHDKREAIDRAKRWRNEHPPDE